MSKFKKWLLPILAAVAILAPSAMAQSFEIGYHYDHRGPAVFSYVTHDFHITNFGSVGLWLSPSMEVTVGRAIFDGWVQMQFLVDAPVATVSVRAKYELIDQRQRAEFRVGLLLGR